MVKTTAETSGALNKSENTRLQNLLAKQKTSKLNHLDILTLKRLQDKINFQTSTKGI
jgi:hypothetical protein